MNDEYATPEDYLDGAIDILKGLIENTDYTASQVLSKAEKELDEKLEEERIKHMENTHKKLGDIQ